MTDSNSGLNQPMAGQPRRQTSSDGLADKNAIPDLDNLMANASQMQDEDTGPVIAQRRRRRRQSRGPVRKTLRYIRRSFSWSILLTAILVVVVVVVVGGAVLVSDAGNQLNSSWASLNRVLNNLTNRPGTELTLTDFDRLKLSISDLSDRLAVARSRARLLAPVSRFNADAAALREMLDIAYDLSSATESMLTGLQPTLFFMVAGAEDESVATGISSGERLVELLEVGRGQFIAADSALQRAGSRLDALSLDGVSPSLLLNVAQLRQFYDQVDSISALLLESPDLLTTILGLEEEKSYLVLAQNNDEIRPSGGFIGTYGWFVVRNGRVIDFDYRASTVSSPNPPRDSFLETFTIPDWWISYSQPIYAAWDGSWHADFAQTADLAASYYNAGNNPQSPVDGVIALDINAFEMLVGALGGVTVPSYNVTVTQENFRDVVYDIRAEESEHKQFLAAMYREIFNAWQSVEQDQTEAIMGVLLEALQGKHLMISFADDDLNQLIGLLGWAGTQQAPEGDYIMVVDANLGNKSNHSVIRSMTYDVTLQSDGSADSRLSVGYSYFDSVASADPAVNPDAHGPLNYRSLLQVFLPLDAILDENADTPRVEAVVNETYTQLVSRITVNYDTSERYQFTYHVPDVVSSLGTYQRYRLFLQKQPGSQVNDVNVQVQLPPGATLVSTSPEAAATYNLERAVVDFRLQQDSDEIIEIIYSP